MLLYANGYSVRQLFQLFGSAVYKLDVLSVGFVVAAATAGLQYVNDQQNEITIPHQYALQVLGGIVTIALAFRTNQAWIRYWDGIHQLHVMYSKWADAYSQFCAFIGVTIMRIYEKGDDGAQEKVAWLRDMQTKVENDFLLLSAMACDRLVRGDCARMRRKSEIQVPWTERIVMREDLRKGTDRTNAKGMPKFRIHSSNSLSCRSMDFDDLDVQGGWSAEYMLHKPPDGRKLDLLAGSADRANMVVNWLNHNLSYCSSELMIPSPIQSRMYQEISNGMVGFNSAVKIADVPYPFPHSQVMVMLLIIFIGTLPVYVMSFTQSMIVGPLLAFLIATFMISMNDIARQLENPYGQGPNQVCVPEFHSRFVLVARDASVSSRSPPSPPKKKTAEEIMHSTRSEMDLCRSMISKMSLIDERSCAGFAPFTHVTTEMDDKRVQRLSSQTEGSINQDQEKLRQEPMATKSQEDMLTKVQDTASLARLYSQLGIGYSEMELILQQLARTHALMEQHLSILSQQLRCLSNPVSSSSGNLDSEIITPLSRPHSFAFQREVYLPRPGQQSADQKYANTRLPDAGALARSSRTISTLILDGCKGSCIGESCKGSCVGESRSDEIDGMASRVDLSEVLAPSLVEQQAVLSLP